MHSQKVDGIKFTPVHIALIFRQKRKTQTKTSRNLNRDTYYFFFNTEMYLRKIFRESTALRPSLSHSNLLISKSSSVHVRTNIIYKYHNRVLQQKYNCIYR